MTSAPRIVIVAPAIPHDASPHAGGTYLQHVVRFAEARGPTTVVVPNTPSNRAALDKSGLPADLRVVGMQRSTSLHARMSDRVVAVAETRLRYVDPGSPSLLLVRSLLHPGPVHDAISSATVVDLQWSECIRLARLVRKINPRARIVGTFHDVQSQLFSREPAERWRPRVYWRFAAQQARQHERRAAADLDELATFSEKDVHLLGDPAHHRVIHPPLASGHERPHSPASGPPTAIFVGDLSRPQNDDAARWLLAMIWPRVLERRPDAHLRLVGRGASVDLLAAAETHPGVVVTGYVDDLNSEYDGASLAVVPMRQGAGVKFKTVEALLHGLPVVTTTVGAEGIEGPDLFAGLTDDPEVFAAATVDALSGSAEAARRAEEARTWAGREYSRDAFVDALTRHYGLSRTDVGATPL